MAPIVLFHVVRLPFMGSAFQIHNPNNQLN